MDDLLRFRRNYILTTETLSNQLLDGWKKNSIGTYNIYYHPEEYFEKIESGDTAVAMFGFMVCPENKLKSNADILSEIVDKKPTLNSILLRSKKYCGRWALVIKTGNEYYVLNDLTGLKQVFYSKINDNIFISSSEHLLAFVKGIGRSEVIKKQLVTRPADEGGYWIPGNVTLYENILCLIPNHLLSFSKFDVQRFWPDTAVDQRDWKKNFQPINNLLQNYTDNFLERYPAAIAFTAGLDSRILLAYCRKHLDKIFAYTVKNNQKERQLDFEIPGIICKKYGIKYSLYESDEAPPPAFVETYNLNASLEREQFRTMAFYLYREYPSERISIQAAINEIARSRYGYKPFVMRIQDLVNITMMGDTTFTRDKFSYWLNDARAVNKKYKVRIEDLFFLEQRLGRWNATNRNEWDIAQDVFEPFNSRLLNEYIFNVHKSDKVRYPNNLYNYLFEQTWPELAHEPGTFPTRDTNFKNKIKQYIKAIVYSFSDK